MKKLIRKEENGRLEVIGVEYEDADGKCHELKCDSVVLTTGGFGFDHSENSLMAQHRPDLIGVPTTNGSFANGDGIKFGHDIGASLVDMDKVQLHPTAFIDPKDPKNHTKYLGPEALRGSGGILLDQRGRRFVNELDLRSKVSNKILENCDPYEMPDGTKGRAWAWCVLNEEAQVKFGLPMLKFYKDRVGLFEAVEGTDGLAKLIGCDEENVKETLREYTAAADQKICKATGKSVFPTRVCESDTSFIVARITPCIHYCMGGLEISSCAEVLQTLSHSAVGKRAKIKRLFAAGECTGGVHGGNRLGGNSLLECVVYGRIAGERAATVQQPYDNCLDKGDWVPLQLREVRQTDEKYGHNTAVYRFNLHGAMQKTGLEVGRFISIRGELDGDTLTGYYSPISRPDDEGIIDILCRTDEKGGPIVKFLLSLRPGASCLMKGMGGAKLIRQPNPDNIGATWSYQGRQIRKLSLLCGGTGLAPAVQIARAYIGSLLNGQPAIPGGVKIVYAAEAAGDLAFVTAFEALEAKYPGMVSHYLVLNRPPPGWTQGIGFVDGDCIRSRLWFPPSDDHVLVMCGPPIFEKIMCSNLDKLGYPREQYYSFDADPENH
jgi:flavocytochrome c